MRIKNQHGLLVVLKVQENGLKIFSLHQKWRKKRKKIYKE